MDNIGLNVTTIRLPQKPQFPKLVEQLIHACHVFRQLKNKPSTKAEAERFLHCHTLIEGLYQTWSCQSPNARLGVFLSPQYYHSKEFGKINHLTSRIKLNDPIRRFWLIDGQIQYSDVIHRPTPGAQAIFGPCLMA